MTSEERRLFARHLALREIGPDGQRLLLAAEVGLATDGAAAAVERAYLERAGVRVVDAAAPLALHALPAALRLRHEAARDVLDGAFAALVQLRAALARGDAS